MKNSINKPSFKLSHTPNHPLVLFNIWDVGSAKVVEKKIKEKMKFPVIGTSSWAIAASQGFEDGEVFPFDRALDNLQNILKNVSIPVTFDFESGFATKIEDVKKNFIHVMNCGIIGINIEDQIINSKGLRYSISDQCEKIKAIKEIIENSKSEIFINARTDIFLQKAPKEHSKADLDEAIERSIAYAKAGADGFFAPGLENKEFIKSLCKTSPIPVNIMISDEAAIQGLSGLGISRFSFGPFIYLKAMNKIENCIEEAISTVSNPS